MRDTRPELEDYCTPNDEQQVMAKILQEKSCRTCAYRFRGNCGYNKIAVTPLMSCSHWISKKRV